MTELELRQAADSAARRVGNERIEFIKSSYPPEYWHAIEYIAGQIDDWSNNIREESEV